MESLAQYLDRLASPSPAPGGGSAATIVGALAAALVAMAARITAAKRSDPERERTALRIADEADRLRSALLEASRRDEEAFAEVVKNRGDERQAALAKATAEPLSAMRLALDVQRLVAQALSLRNAYLASDLGAGNELAAAALASSAYNVRINHRAMHDGELVARQAAEMVELERESAALLEEIRGSLRD